MRKIESLVKSVCLMLLLTLAFNTKAAGPCDGSITMVSETPIGGGQYEYVFLVCPKVSNYWMGPDEMNISFYPFDIEITDITVDDGNGVQTMNGSGRTYFDPNGDSWYAHVDDPKYGKYSLTFVNTEMFPSNSADFCITVTVTINKQMEKVFGTTSPYGTAYGCNEWEVDENGYTCGTPCNANDPVAENNSPPVSCDVQSGCSDEQCNEGGNQASFNLLNLNNCVSGDSAADYSVAWYLDANLSTSVTNPSAHITGNTTVYAEITSNNTGCTNSTSVSLTVSSSITANNATVNSCDGDYDLTSANLTVYPNYVGNTNITYYTDQNLTNQITDTLTYTASNGTVVYAEVEDYLGCVGSSEVTLTLQTVSVQSPTFSECGAGGVATVDLTSYYNNIYPAGLANFGHISFFTDAGRTQLITDTTAYNHDATSNGPAIYFTVTSYEGCVGQGFITINVNDIANDNYNYEACETSEGSGVADFDLSSIENVVGNGNTTTFYEDQGLTTLISTANPYQSGNGTIYAYVDGGSGCQTTVSVLLTVNGLPTVDNTQEYRICDDGSGTATFDLTTYNTVVSNNASGVSVSWSDNGTSINSPNSFLSGSKTIQALITNNITGCSNTASFALQVSPISASGDQLDACGDGGSADFDLTSADLQTNGNDYRVTWYETNNNGALSDQIGAPSNYNSTGSTVYAHIEDTTLVPACETIVPVILNIDGVVATDTTFTICATEETGEAIVDLSDFGQDVGGLNIVTWWEDANATSNEINPTTNYTLTNGATLYAKVVGQNGDNCEDIATVQFIVNPLPETQSYTFYACAENDSTAIFDLSSQDAWVSNNASGVSVEWFRDNSYTDTVQSPSTFSTSNFLAYYNVTINATGCNYGGFVTTNMVFAELSGGGFASGTICDNGNGTGTFDLTSIEVISGQQASASVSWFEDFNLSINAIPEDAYIGTDGQLLFAHVSVTENTVTCVDTSIVTLSLSNTDVFDAGGVQECSNGDGSTTYNLSDKDPVIMGATGVSSGYTVKWYTNSTDATNDVNEITDPTAFTTADQTISVFAVVQASVNCKSNVQEVFLNSLTAPSIDNTPLTDCSDENGEVEFDLTSVSVGNGITTWKDNNDQNISGNDLLSYTITSTTFAKAILTDNKGCKDSTFISLAILPTPTADSTNFSLCDNDGNDMAVFNLDDSVDVIGNGLSVSWYTDSELTDPISFTSSYMSGNAVIYAEVTNVHGCSDYTGVNLELLHEKLEIATVTGLCEDNSTNIGLEYTGIQDSVQWSFDVDSTIVNEELEMIHSYNELGDKQLTVVVYEGACFYTSTQEIKIGTAFEIEASEDEEIYLGESTTLSTDHPSGEHLWEGEYIDDETNKFPTVSPIETSEYIVQVTNKKGCVAFDTVVVTVDSDKDFEIPTSFTPNGDGLNDFFTIPNEGVCSIDMTIINRWGNVVAVVTDPNEGWDGTHMETGRKQPIDSYMFSLEVNFCDGSSYETPEGTPIKGMIHLLR